MKLIKMIRPSGLEIEIPESLLDFGLEKGWKLKEEKKQVKKKKVVKKVKKDK